MPGPEKALEKPHDERLKRVTLKFVVMPGPAVDTQDVVPQAGRLVATGNGYEPYRLVDADGWCRRRPRLFL